MTAIPYYGYALCKCINDNDEYDIINGFKFKKEVLKQYQILKLGNMPDNFRFNVDDIIITNSIPTKINLDNNTYYLINNEYIAGKIS